MFEFPSVANIDHWIAEVPASPYLAILLLLLAGIWVIPLAEEIALVAAGYLYYSDQVQLLTMLFILSVGVFAGDFAGFWVGRRWVRRRSRKIFPFLDGSRHNRLTDRFKSWLDNHRNRALFITRFLPGLRLPAHIIVGAHGMPTTTYARISFVAILFYVPTIFAISFSFGAEIHLALESLQRLGNLTWTALGLAVVAWCFVRLRITRQSLFEGPRPGAE